MRSEARKDYGCERKLLTKTGGGKQPAQPKETSRRIIELFGDEPGFSGIQGGLASGGKYSNGAFKQ